MANLKLKILALHGYQQSDKIFKVKIASLRQRFKKEVDFIFVKAPHIVPEMENELDCNKEESSEKMDDSEKYGWWIPQDEPVGFDESVEMIQKIFQEHGPFDGILGFSQGGAFVSILCFLQQRKILDIQFNFAIIISGFKTKYESHQDFYKEQLLLPTLHVYGQEDKVIVAKRSQDLSDIFLNKQVVIHEGGHYAPGKKDIYNEFIKEMLHKKSEIQPKLAK